MQPVTWGCFQGVYFGGGAHPRGFPEGDPAQHGPAVRRDVLALRAVQSLAVLDVRNYRDLVFRIGEFEADGEDPELGRALP